MKYLFVLLCFSLCASCISIKADVNPAESQDNHITPQKADFSEAEAGIRLVMKQQETAWNNHDLEGFMQGYWKSEDLKFYGASGLTKGWDQTLANYKKGYPTKAESGTLNFTIKGISKIEDNSYYVMGEFYLTREMGDANGQFLIIFRKIKGDWKIIADMTC